MVKVRESRGRNNQVSALLLRLSAAANHTALGIWAISREAHPSRRTWTSTPLHTAQYVCVHENMSLIYHLKLKYFIGPQTKLKTKGLLKPHVVLS